MTEQNLPDKFEQCLDLSGTEREKEFFSKPEQQVYFEPDEIAYKRLKVIYRALNLDENDIPVIANWVDGKQNIKYFPWARVQQKEGQPAAFVFSCSGYGGGFSGTGVGSRLCNNISPYRAKYAVDTFPEEHKAFWF